MKMFSFPPPPDGVESGVNLSRELRLCRPAFEIRQDNQDVEPLKRRVLELESHVKMLLEERNSLEILSTNNKIEMDALRKKVIFLHSRLLEATKQNHVLKQANGRNEKRIKRARDEIESLESVSKRQKLTSTTSTQTEVPSNLKVQTLLHDLTLRQENSKNYPYTELLREFSFTLHYLSPAAYRYVRNYLEKLLPHSCTFQRWTNFVDPSPG
ncbi:unnamed protein product [Orchesella dallaii]|uniref:THAP9-like helix-turn-helix domain-containing protein n=1 Tax=Orchesella dallaii TaxID=48710 RepID=A0ABP1Q121_9HEXA